MLTTLLIITGVIVCIAVFVLYCTLKNAPDGHEDAGGFHIDSKSKTGRTETKQSKSRKKRSGAVAGKSQADAA